MRQALHRFAEALWTWTAIVSGAVVTTLPQEAPAPAPGSFDEGPALVERDLSGPRVGFTLRPDTYSENGVGPIVSQFGWHFEHQVSGEKDGPQFLTEVVPLVAGVEYGKFVPSISFGVGVRTTEGYEFGLGPTFSAGSDDGSDAGSSAMFVTAGRSYDFGGVRVPLNLVLVANHDGARATVLAGYAIRRESRRIGP